MILPHPIVMILGALEKRLFINMKPLLTPIEAVSIGVFIQAIICLYMYNWAIKRMRKNEKTGTERKICKEFYSQSHEFSDLDKTLNIFNITKPSDDPLQN